MHFFKSRSVKICAMRNFLHTCVIGYNNPLTNVTDIKFGKMGKKVKTAKYG